MVTIIVPTRRRPQLLARAIRSVQAQTRGDVTIAVTDNASGDATRDVVASLMAGDPRIRYHEQPRDLGQHGNFQHALARVETPYFTLLSDDDLLLPNFVEQSVAALQTEPEAMFVSSPVLIVDAEGRLLMVHGAGWPARLYRPPQGLLELTRRGHFIWTGTLFRTAVRHAVGIDPETGNSSDMDFQLQVAARFPFATRPLPAAIFSWHPDSPSSHPGLSVFWPTWRKIMSNLEAVETLPEVAKKQAISNLDRRLHRSLVLVGLYAASRRRWQDADGSAKLLSERYRDATAALSVRSTAWLARRVPPMPAVLASIAWQLRWYGRWRLGAIQRDLDKQFPQLLAVDPLPRPSPATGEGESSKGDSSYTTVT